MSRIAVIGLCAAFGLAPAIAWATCGGEHDDSAASAASPAKLALAPGPAATKLPANVTKAAAPNAVKKPTMKAKPSAPEGKLVATSTN